MSELIKSWQNRNLSRKLADYKGSDANTDIVINMGSSSLDESLAEDRESYLESIRDQITDGIITDLIKQTAGSANVYTFFKHLDEAGIPLVYLEALRVSPSVSEDIAEYQALKQRNIDPDLITLGLQGDYQGLDEDYVKRVLSESHDVPKLKNPYGKVIPDIIRGKKPALEDYSSAKAVKLQNEVDALKGQLQDLQHQLKLERGNLLKGYDINDPIDRMYLLQYQQDLQKGITYRRVFVLCDHNYKLPVVFRYQIIKVDNMGILSFFGERASDLLVLTNDLVSDEGFLQELVDWLGETTSNNGSLMKHIVNLKGHEVPLLESLKNVSLDVLSLDTFYKENFPDLANVQGGSSAEDGEDIGGSNVGSEDTEPNVASGEGDASDYDDQDDQDGYDDAGDAST